METKILFHHLTKNQFLNSLEYFIRFDDREVSLTDIIDIKNNMISKRITTLYQNTVLPRSQQKDAVKNNNDNVSGENSTENNASNDKTRYTKKKEQIYIDWNQYRDCMKQYLFFILSLNNGGSGDDDGHVVKETTLKETSLFSSKI